MTDQKEFPSGIRFTDPHPKQPNFVLGKVSFKVDEFIQYLQEKADNGWVNLILKESQKGVKYFELDTWKPGQTEKYKPQEKVGDNSTFGAVAGIHYPKDEPKKEYCDKCLMEIDSCICGSTCEECGHPKVACNCHILTENIPF